MKRLVARRVAAVVKERRATILHVAGQVASIEGFDGLSIGRLADRMQMSKSGVFAHFGSKEQLQLATLQSAIDVFLADVWAPVCEVPAGARRLLGVTDAWLSYLEREVFPGGCVLSVAAVEFDSRPGAVHDAVARATRAWLSTLAREVSTGQAAGEIPEDVAPADTAFELNALATAANVAYQLHRDARVFVTARRAMYRLLGAPLRIPAVGTDGRDLEREAAYRSRSAAGVSGDWTPRRRVGDDPSC